MSFVQSNLYILKDIKPVNTYYYNFFYSCVELDLLFYFEKVNQILNICLTLISDRLVLKKFDCVA